MDHTPEKLSFIQFEGEMRLITNDIQMAEIDFSGIKAFGFDTETKPAFKKGDHFKTALLQLATDSTAYLIRLHYIREFNSIRKVFEDASILKAGAAIAHDLKELQRIFPFQPKGFVDVQTVARQKGLQKLGLKSMTEEVLGATIRKGPKMTNWEKQVLTEEQLMYAATDAWLGLKLYRALSEKT